MHHQTKHQSPHFEHIEDSQANDYFQKQNESLYSEQFQSNNELQPLIYNTLQLQYDLFLFEQQHNFYKEILAQKESQIKRLKEKLTKKNSKISSIVQNLKKLDKKIKQVKEGYKKINIKRQEIILDQIKQRNERLIYQQKKGILYAKCGQLQEIYSNMSLEIEQYRDVEAQFEKISSENDELSQQIEQFQSKRSRILNNQSVNKKQALKSEVKKMYQRIKQAEKQDEHICNEYSANRRALNDMQKEQNTINHQNIEIEGLYHRIEKLREDIKARKWEKMEREKEYHQLYFEEGELKREINTETEYKENQKKIKQNMVHNFKIIDSEADEELFKTGELMKNNHSSSLESQEHFEELVNRFQKIKSKSKNAT